MKYFYRFHRASAWKSLIILIESYTRKTRIPELARRRIYIRIQLISSKCQFCRSERKFSPSVYIITTTATRPVIKFRSSLTDCTIVL